MNVAPTSDGWMPRTSAGILLYRTMNGVPEVFLVHPGGPYWAAKDLGVWSVPKGEPGPDEDPLAAARREFTEETGFSVEGEPVALEPIRQSGGKLVRAWALEGNVDPDSLRSNTFTMEWPPRSGRQRAFPEVDRAAWFPLPEARRRILAGQVGLLDQLERRLGQDR